MKEQELNLIMDVISDPIKNVYDISNKKNIQQIQRLIKTFELSKEQQIKHHLLSVKNLATLRLMMSNN